MIVIALLLLQVTDCTTNGNRTQCRTQPQIQQQPVGPNDYSGGTHQSYGNAGQGLGAAFRARKARRAQKKIGTMIAEGRCAEARQEALKSGDLDMAERVQGLCR